MQQETVFECTTLNIYIYMHYSMNYANNMEFVIYMPTIDEYWRFVGTIPYS